MFGFRPLTEKDLPLLLEWLNRPHLQEWWREGERSLEELRDKYLPRIAGGDAARPFLAYEDGEAVGYIQYYVAAEGSADGWPDQPGPGVLGIDQFLADVARSSKGHPFPWPEEDFVVNPVVNERNPRPIEEDSVDVHLDRLPVDLVGTADGDVVAARRVRPCRWRRPRACSCG